MGIRMRTAFAGLAVLAFTAGPVGLTQASMSKSLGYEKATKTRVFTLDPSTAAPDDNPEGVAWDPGSESFFVGATGTGTIYRGRLDDRILHPFITPDPDAPADSALGMKVAGGKLYVAGGPTGSIYVYRIKTGALLARFETGPDGFLNDLVVTRRGDVYVTDSFRPAIWHLTPAMVKAGGGTPEKVDVEPEVAHTAGQFNLNGIVSLRGGRELIVINSVTRLLFRIDIDPRNVAARTITRIDAPDLGGEGDGLLLDRGRLLVVVNAPSQVAVLKLSRHDLRARLDRMLTDPALREP
ncbi:MAG: hypothetical protein QOE58_1980, partial [Actinomycetota bacterium]|nr:hypothetical protein [Actinomycetota bacterium]